MLDNPFEVGTKRYRTRQRRIKNIEKARKKERKLQAKKKRAEKGGFFFFFWW